MINIQVITHILVRGNNCTHNRQNKTWLCLAINCPILTIIIVQIISLIGLKCVWLPIHVLTQPQRIYRGIILIINTSRLLNFCTKVTFNVFQLKSGAIIIIRTDHE